MGKYKFQTATSSNLELSPLYTYENGSRYIGQWNPTTDIREGKGILVKVDGSIYEGYWKNNKFNGKGRKIYSDGGIYEGDWL